jgi:histidinol-phosphatase (PHP family)
MQLALLTPLQKDLSPTDLLNTFTAYLTEAHRLKVKYAHVLDLLVGLETDYITPLDIQQLEQLLQAEEETGAEVEYVVGSVHHVAEQGIDFSKEWWEACVNSFSTDTGTDHPTLPPPPHTQRLTKALPDVPFPPAAVTAYLHAYLDAHHTLITRIQPTVIGHFDLCRLYIPKLPLNHPSLPGVWEKVERNIKEVVAYGGLFEVSAASFRKGWDEGYPGSEVLQVRYFPSASPVIYSLPHHPEPVLLIRLQRAHPVYCPVSDTQCIIANRGRLCLSDDSHGPASVALNYTRLRTYLVEQGVTELWYLASNTTITGNSDSNASMADGNTTPSESVAATATPAVESTGESKEQRPWLVFQRRKLTPQKYDGKWADDPFWTRLSQRQT